MKNDARVGDTVISVRPTLLISLIGVIADVRRAMTTDFKHSGDLIYLVGETKGALAGSVYERISGELLDGYPSVDTQSALASYRALSSCIADGLVASVHDLSDGGLAVSLAESAIGGNCGAKIDLAAMPGYDAKFCDERLLFDESPSRFIVSVPPANRDEFELRMEPANCALVGSVAAAPEVEIARGERITAVVPLEKLRLAFAGGVASPQRESS